MLDEPQTVTVPIPQQQEDADSPYEEDDGITDYGIPADPQPVQTVPRPSAQPDNDSGYEADSGDSPYESNDDSGGNSPYESNDDSGGTVLMKVIMTVMAMAKAARMTMMIEI